MRGERRFQTRKKKIQQIQFLWNDWGRDLNWSQGQLIDTWSLPGYLTYKPYRIVKYWRPKGRMTMSESGHSAWKRIMMNRPHRAEKRRIEKAITAGRLDPEEAMFPVWGKPFIYYW